MKSGKPKTKRKPEPKSPNPSVNWLDLPRDVTIQILLKLGTLELLYNAQHVCSAWRNLAQDPQLYRVVDLRNPWSYFHIDTIGPLEDMATCSIDRSGGQVVEFSIEGWCTNVVLNKLMHKTPQMKCLHLWNCNGFGEECLIEVVRSLPLLEEVEFILPWFSKRVLEAVGESCPKLRLFRLNGHGGELSEEEDTDEEEDREWINGEAIAIAEYMNPGLRSLHLLGNLMNNNGLEAILERFTQLEYLDLRRCDNLRLAGDLLKKCQGIKTLRLPGDSIEDYQFVVGEPDEGEGESDFDGAFNW